jgi:hypothetical protein
MKRWAVITVALYLATLLLLTVPVFAACFGWGKDAMTLRDIVDNFREWGYWIWIAVSVVAQVLLLLVPVALGERRPRSRRSLMVPVVTAAFLFAVVCVSAVTAVCCGIWGDHADKLYCFFGPGEKRILAVLVTYLVVTWAVWFFVFRRFVDVANPEALTPRLMRWLLRGSILELLIAVPSHVISRNRHDCCAPIGTFWGIATGITVMLLSFGPGVLYLFAARMRRLQPSQDKTNL